MKEQDLAELIPKLSLRIKFRQRLDEWKANQSGDDTLEKSLSSSSLKKQNIDQIVSTVVFKAYYRSGQPENFRSV